jgi:CHAT domain-containing protein/Tfp pilus assembly protein PilF
LLNNLATLYREQGLYSRAEQLYKQALVIQEVSLGENHPNVALLLNNLAILYDDQGLYARAEPLHKHALAIWEAALGKNHPNVAGSLTNLANLYYSQGLLDRAEPLHKQALEIAEATLGKNHSQVAIPLINLANLYLQQEAYALAAPHYERALRIGEMAFGEEHPNVALSLNNLAALYHAQGHYTLAEPLYERALRIRESTLSKSHPHVATSLHNLANLYANQGHYARAKLLYERALAIRESTLGENHPDVALLLNSIARLHLAHDNLTEALPLFTRAFAISEEHLRQEVFGFSEVRLASLLRLLREDEERLYSLARAHLNDARVRHLALSTSLLRKGRSVEELADTSRIIFRSLANADREAFERLRALRTQFSVLSLAGPGSLSSTDYQNRLKELAATASALEEYLSKRSAPLRAISALPTPDKIITHVVKALPKDGALIEFIVYRDSPLAPRPATPSLKSPGQLRYLALLLLADGLTHAVDLGPAEPIDTAALRLHDAFARQSASYEPAAQALYKLVFRPLLPYLGKAQRLFLSPDGQLALIPFAALHDGSRFLVDALDITYVTSGKDLLPRVEDAAPARSVVVLADPDFDSSPAPSTADHPAPALAARSISLDHFFSSRSVPQPDTSWEQLPGTRREAETIQRLIPQAQLLLGPSATKRALLTLKTPGVLHIATHGFFLEDAATPATTTRAVGHFGALGEAGPGQRPPDPLLRSGLVLAGAGARPVQATPHSREDSIVTALELAGLDLWGTQLVVLSACDTGRGDIKLGQGVYGMRRALVVAGAESLVTTLWKVNDKTSHELIERYYSNLLAGEDRAEALRTAMRALRQKHPHPYFWAPFITIGQDGRLRNLMPN